MSDRRKPQGQGDARLWALALGLSLLGNAAFVIIAGFTALNSHLFHRSPPTAAPPPPAETTITLIAEPPRPAPTAEDVPEPAAAAPSRVVRTSEDQRADRPATPLFLGERDTRATSDRAPVAGAPPLPSQEGLEPRNEDDFETTESDYQDGKLENDSPQAPPAPPSPMAAEMAAPVAAAEPMGEPTEDPGKAEEMKSAPPREALVEGPNPVDIPVPPDPADPSAEDTPRERPKDGGTRPERELQAEQDPKPAAPKTPTDPGFRGFQRKRAISGSISRTGRSALDVADSPLGRYQIAISRAVEREWQRNCVRHRDFITPGFLTVRFFVEGNGKVKSVQFVGDMETGEIQKGFTLNSIRDAEIPAMPQALRAEFDTEPLELIFNFYF